MIFGYMNRVVTVDLASDRIRETTPSEETYLQFLGGYGLAVRAIYDAMKPNTDPLGPASVFAIMTGPLTGTPAVIGTRFAVAGKSPLTGTWGDANCGGRFGPALKFAGFDGVLFEGISPHPVYVVLDNGICDIRDASRIWGKDTAETEDLLKMKHGKNAQVASIGPAGEKLVRIACIINEKGRAAARSGLGAIMGSKRLKAVVATGNLKVPLADEKKIAEIRKQCVKEIAEGVGFADSYKKGTPTYNITGVECNDSSIKNWSGVGVRDFPTNEKIGYAAIEKYHVRRYGCWQCPISCGQIVSVRDGPYRTKESHRPEYETCAAFGSNCMNDDVESLIKLNDVCNRYGVDTISAGSLVSFAIECYQNGLLSMEDNGGLKLKWGDHGAVVDLVSRICNREGIGNLLADGLEKAVERIGKGSEGYAIHIRGEALPMHDPRCEPALAVIYKLNATPAHHLQASQFIPPPDLAIEAPKWGEEFSAPRGKTVKILECLMHVVQCVGLCCFGYLSTSVRHLPEMLSAVTGWRVTLDDLVTTGERIANMRQAFNVREGLNSIEFAFPDRALGKPPLQEGPTKGRTVGIQRLSQEYLRAFDWDLNSAKPSRLKLTSLRLDDVADDLYPYPPDEMS